MHRRRVRLLLASASDNSYTKRTPTNFRLLTKFNVSTTSIFVIFLYVSLSVGNCCHCSGIRRPQHFWIFDPFSPRCQQYLFCLPANLGYFLAPDTLPPLHGRLLGKPPRVVDSRRRWISGPITRVSSIWNGLICRAAAAAAARGVVCCHLDPGSLTELRESAIF